MKRNIGKDLSKVSMPVVLNEPIGKEKQKTKNYNRPPPSVGCERHN